MPAECQLPDVGEVAGNDQQRGCLRRSHSQTEQTHGDGWQAETDDAFDHAGQEEGGNDQQRQSQPEVLIERGECIHGAMVSPDWPRENLPYTETAS